MGFRSFSINSMQPLPTDPSLYAIWNPFVISIGQHSAVIQTFWTQELFRDLKIVEDQKDLLFLWKVSIYIILEIKAKKAENFY